MAPVHYEHCNTQCHTTILSGSGLQGGYGSLGTKTFGRQTFGRQFFEMTIWATRVGHLGNSNRMFERQASRRLGNKNEALCLVQPQSEGRVSDYQYLVASGHM